MTTKSRIPSTNSNTNNSKVSTMLSVLPFRYAFASDGCTLQKPVLPLQRNSQPLAHSNSIIDASDISSSSLSGRYYQNGLSMDEDVMYKKSQSDFEERSGSFDRINSIQILNKNFFVPDDDETDLRKNKTDCDDEEHDTFDENTRMKKGLESVQSEANFSNLYNTTSTLPNKISDDSSGLRKYAIRRHHSAPQSDAKWLQVCFKE